ncbi:dipeptide ABC transporter ATP-binding protein [bacterium]|nr:dipeptide ABC transporter ATP-binding protein [bacterium]
MPDIILNIENLKQHFPTYGGIFRRQVATVYAVDGVSLKVKRGETVGVVGESGCGKTTLGRSLLRLYNPTGGRIIYNGQDITALPQKQLRPIRREMQMIFQDPFESLNSRHTVGEVLEEPFIIHKTGDSKEKNQKVRQLLDRVGLNAKSTDRYPHEFSGGQRQRIGIARAIALNPKLIVCDEPVSALDVSIQSQILNLLLELQREMSLTYVFISHDLAVVKHISDRIAVMYLGKVVEYASSNQIVRSPLHPYTQALISAIPIPDPEARHSKVILTGDVPSPIHPPSGCCFHTRCPAAKEICKTKVPELVAYPLMQEHEVACHFAGEINLLR